MEDIGCMIIEKVYSILFIFLDWIWKKSKNNFILNDVAPIEDIINELNTMKFDVRKEKLFNLLNNFRKKILIILY